jgi:hypothetical protein
VNLARRAFLFLVRQYMRGRVARQRAVAASVVNEVADRAWGKTT